MPRAPSVPKPTQGDTVTLPDCDDPRHASDNGGNKGMRAQIGVAGSGALPWADSAPRQITQDANGSTGRPRATER